MKMLTYAEASEFLGVKTATLYSMVHRNAIPHFRLGRRLVRFRLDDLEAWLAARRGGPSEQA